MSCEFIEKLLTSLLEPVIKVIGALAVMSSSLQRVKSKLSSSFVPVKPKRGIGCCRDDINAIEGK